MWAFRQLVPHGLITSKLECKVNKNNEISKLEIEHFTFHNTGKKYLLLGSTE